MDDLFSDLRDDDYLDETSPMDETGQMDDLPETRPLNVDDDEFDMLRQKTVRSGSTFDDMDTSVDEEFGGSGFSLSSLTTSQKLILLSLLMLDIVAVGFGLLVFLGIV
ncbi:MAG: hypothetical protein P8183_22105 [Anaerolineae bacterium]